MSIELPRKFLTKLAGRAVRHGKSTPKPGLPMARLYSVYACTNLKRGHTARCERVRVQATGDLWTPRLWGGRVPMPPTPRFWPERFRGTTARRLRRRGRRSAAWIVLPLLRVEAERGWGVRRRREDHRPAGDPHRLAEVGPSHRPAGRARRCLPPGHQPGEPDVLEEPFLVLEQPLLRQPVVGDFVPPRRVAGVRVGRVARAPTHWSLPIPVGLDVRVEPTHLVERRRGERRVRERRHPVPRHLVPIVGARGREWTHRRG